MNGTSSVGLPGWSFLRLPIDGKSVAEAEPCDTDIDAAGNAQAASKSIMEVVSFIAQIHRTYGVQGNGSVVEEIKKLVNHYTVKVTSNSLKSIKDGEELPIVMGEFSCPICFSVINEPQTIRCGHSYCKKCLLKEAVGNSCKLCKYKLTATDVKDSKTNVLLLSLFETLWANENKATALRNQGNDFFCKKELNKALSKYSDALKLCANDHLSLCNRSHVLLTLGESENALVDAEEAIKSCPTWPKSYYRKAVSFTSLGRYEEAFLSLIPCIFLITATKTATEATLSPVKNEMCKVVQKLLQSSPVVGQPSLRRHTLDQKPFSPYPSQKKSSSKADQSWCSNTCSESEYYSSGDEADTAPSLKRRLFSFHEPSSKTCGVVDPFVARIRRIFSKGLKDLEVLEDQLKKMPRPNRAFDKPLIAASDFECSLCYRLLYQPVTTACGHTYCKSCLERCLDHSPTCPLCKTALQDYFTYQRHSITHIINDIISEYLPVEHAERVNQHLEELAAGGILGVSTKLEVPIFVCTMAFPTVPCPLHVFEPRYRLMIRRCMESGTKQFGMCCYLQEGLHNYADFGTLLEIRSVQYFPDGRSVVDTIGIKRFKVLSKSMKDGYHTATIELLHDRPIEESERSELQDSHEKVFKEANEWLSSISQVLRQRIYTHFGQMPEPDEDWIKVPNGPSWTWWLLAILPLETKAQLSILSMNSLLKRLESIQRVLQVVKVKLTAGSQ